MRGSVKKRGATWVYVVDLGKDHASGKRLQHLKRGFGTRKAAEEALTDALAKVNRGEFVRPAKGTVGQYLTEQWLPIKRLDLRESTWHGYEKQIRAKVVPMIGHLELSKLDAATLEMLYARLRTEGGAGGRPLSPKTVRNIAGIMYSALGDATRLKQLPRNPCADTKLSRVQKREMRTWSESDAEAFVTRTREFRLWPLWRLALSTGLRRGELCGLRWDDVKFDDGTVYVGHTRTTAGKAIVSVPKTDAGFRTVSVDGATMTVLRAWKRCQAEERLAAGPAWVDTPYVFTREGGEPPHPGWVTKRWNEDVAAAGVPAIRLHDARHTAATIMLRARVPVKVVSERLGHANVGITLDVYAHVTKQDDREAAAVLGRVLGDS